MVPATPTPLGERELMLPFADVEIPAFEILQVPQYMMAPNYDFSCLGATIYDINRLTDAFDLRFSGMCKSLPPAPRSISQTVTNLAWTLVEQIIHRRDNGQLQTDYELTVQQHIEHFRLEQPTYVVPSWEDW